MKREQKSEFLSSRVRYIPVNTIRPNPQQPQLVGHGGLGTAQLFRRLLLAQVVPPDQRRDGGGLLHVIQVTALQIFDERQQRRVLLPYLGHQTGHLPQSGHPGGPQPPLSRHQLVIAALVPHRQRL